MSLKIDTEEVKRKIDKIKKELDYKTGKEIELYRNGKMILKGDTIDELRALIKENIKAPKNDKQVFIVQYGINEKTRNPISFGVYERYITNDLDLVRTGKNLGKQIFINKEELLKYGFEKKFVKKLIKALIKNKVNQNPFQIDTLETLFKIKYD